jgi:hypothetical protein
MVHQAFPDMRVEVHEVIAEGELVAARVTDTGTHQGEFVGIAATGRKITTSGVDFSGCRAAGRSSIGGGPDMLGFLMQLGVMPGPGAPGPGTPA